MITVKLVSRNGKFSGFDVSGHSGYAESGSDIVCAAVSSAVGLCETIISDSLKVLADIKIEPEDARIVLSVREEDIDACNVIFEGFARHVRAIAEEYPEYIEVLEVQ